MLFSFGGGKHLNEGDIYHDGVTVKDGNMRPEFIKTFRCERDASNIAEECAECIPDQWDGNCWKGSGQFGRSMLNVRPGPQATNIYRLEVWGRCAPGEAGKSKNWEMHLQAKSSGTLRLYLNNILQQELVSNDKTTVTLEQVADDSRLHIDYIPSNSLCIQNCHLPAKYQISAKVDIQLGARLDKSMDDCMSGKICLAKLGDGSNEGRLLRNSNPLQLKCLDATDDAARNAISSNCEAWERCLREQNMKVGVSSLLRASLESGTSSPTTSSTRPPDDPNCIDPKVADVESLDCECLPQMQATCGGALNAECIKCEMCKHSGVCSSWKSAMCSTCPSSLNAVDTSNPLIRRMRARRVEKNASLLNKRAEDQEEGVDAAAAGKCTV
jgi:hypothetical protein